MSSSSNSNQINFVIARIAMDAANRLSAIAAEMGQLLNEIQEHRRVLNFREVLEPLGILQGKKRAFALPESA